MKHIWGNKSFGCESGLLILCCKDNQLSESGYSLSSRRVGVASSDQDFSWLMQLTFNQPPNELSSANLHRLLPPWSTFPLLKLYRIPSYSAPGRITARYDRWSNYRSDQKYPTPFQKISHPQSEKSLTRFQEFSIQFEKKELVIVSQIHIPDHVKKISLFLNFRKAKKFEDGKNQLKRHD